MFPETHQEWLVPVRAEPGRTSGPASSPQDLPVGPSDCSCCLQLPLPVTSETPVYAHSLHSFIMTTMKPVASQTCDSFFRSTDCPSSDCTSVFTGRCSLVGGWPGSESGSWMKSSSSCLLRLHLRSRSGRTSGSGGGGGLKPASVFFISTSSGSCFTEDQCICIRTAH